MRPTIESTSHQDSAVELAGLLVDLFLLQVLFQSDEASLPLSL